jgi:FKBP-type peptidyl-prolyl cis-trans isomerase
VKLKWMAGLALGLLAVSVSAQEPAAPKTQKDKVSYFIGVQVAASIKSQGIDIDPDLLIKGLKDALAGGKLLMTDDDLQATMTALQADMTQKQQQARTAAAESNKKEGEAFLTANAKKEGVVALPSGLQYKILKAGDGKKPTDSDSVVCNYRGTLIDGTEFDSSSAHGDEPATFAVQQLIPGFREALKLMPSGSKWQFFIPADLAYGENGAGNAIGPNSALIFEIELLSIKDKP